MNPITPDISALGGLLAGLGAAGLAAGIYIQRREDQFQNHLQTLANQAQTTGNYIANWVHAVGEGQSRKELFEELIKAIQATTDANTCCVFEKQDDGTLLGCASAGLFPPLRALKTFSTRAELFEYLLKGETYRMGDGLIGSVARSKETLFIPRAATDARIFRHDDPSLRLRSLIAIPMLFKDELIGVLALANPRGKAGFTSDDFRFAQSLAEQASLAIHNSDIVRLRVQQSRFDFDLSVASSIQTMLLPGSFPNNALLDIAARYQPAQKVGGDLYDVFELPEGQIGVAIADVSGKGIPASLLMAITQSHLRHLARKNHSPARVLTELNKILEPDIRQDMFVTMTYAIIDPEGNEINLARAGHELPLVANSDGTEFLFSDGIAIGMAPKELFEATLVEKRYRFAKGDRIVLYTDGLTEAINSVGEEFSSKRVAEVVAQTPEDASSEQINSRLIKTIENFTGRRQQDDDVTLLTIRHL